MFTFVMKHGAWGGQRAAPISRNPEPYSRSRSRMEQWTVRNQKPWKLYSLNPYSVALWCYDDYLWNWTWICGIVLLVRLMIWKYRSSFTSTFLSSETTLASLLQWLGRTQYPDRHYTILSTTPAAFSHSVIMHISTFLHFDTHSLRIWTNPIEIDS